MPFHYEVYFESIYRNGSFIDKNCSFYDLLAIKKELNHFIKTVSVHLALIGQTKLNSFNEEDIRLRDLAFKFKVSRPGKIIIHSEIDEALETNDILIYSGGINGLRTILEFARTGITELQTDRTKSFIKSHVKSESLKKLPFYFKKPALDSYKKSFFKGMEIFKPPPSPTLFHDCSELEYVTLQLNEVHI